MPSRFAKLPQHVDRAGSVVAEEEIGAFDHRLRLQRVGHNLLKKLIRRKLQQRFVGGIGDRRVDTQFGQQFRFAVGPRQRRRRLLRAQNPHRMRIEREHHRRSADCFGLCQQSLHNPRMPQVHAVEVANRHSAAADDFGQVRKIAQQFHDINLRTGPRSDNLMHGLTNWQRASLHRRSGIVCAIL